jgi:protein PhnA
MTIESSLQERSQSKCELCASDSNLSVYEIPPTADGSADKSILICDNCLSQIENPEAMNVNHWRCLNDSMWSEFPAVQVMAWRMLKRLSNEGWAQDLIEQLYLDEETLKWASAMESESGPTTPTKDSNGTQLQAGDTVTLIKDLVVKGANFTAKRGTVVRNISLTDDPKHIEGKVNGTQIVLVAAFLKKA